MQLIISSMSYPMTFWFRLVKTEESNYSNSIRTFQQSLYTTSKEHTTDNDGAAKHDQVTASLIVPIH